MRTLGFFIMLGLSVVLLKACVDGAWRADDAGAVTNRMLQTGTAAPETPDLIPDPSSKPISAAAVKKAAMIKPDRLCLALGKAMRGRDAEFQRAMIQRAADERIAVLKFEQQSDIRTRQIRIGITPCLALASWGRPERVNRSVGSFGVHEQWVYPSAYLYFEDQVLTSWQD